MVTKWKNISEKWCGKRQNRLLLWVAVFISLILFFWSFGFAASGDDGLRSFLSLKNDPYLSSEYHVSEIRAAFWEVLQTCLGEDREDILSENMDFQGVYEFRMTDMTSLNQNNIPKKAYDDHISELWKSVMDEAETDQIREVPDKLADSIRKDEASWYFKKNIPCYYRWDGESYRVSGNDDMASELLREIGPLGANVRITIGFTDQMLEQGEQKYAKIRTQVYIGCVGMLFGIAILLAALLVLIPDVYRNRRGKRYCDILVLAALYAICVLPERVQGLILSNYYTWTTIEFEIVKELFPSVYFVAVGSMVLLFSVIHLVCLAVGLKRAGKGKFLAIFKGDHGFISRIIVNGKRRITGEAYVKDGILDCNRKRLRFAQILSGILIFLAGVSVFSWDWGAFGGWWWLIDLLLFGVLIAVVAYLYHSGTKRIRSAYDQLSERIDQICEGGSEATRGATPESSEFFLFEDELGKLSVLERQMQENIQKQVQAERMKMDLITNVSHDLKTPLTSLISYIDLLSKEDLPPAAADYVKVLERKSEQLRKMVADVFDLAKASSGNLEVKQERVELNRLLVQTLADMEREIESAPVKVVRQLPDTIAVLESDGDKLYRVFQNIFQNALKYSMRGTRVFVTLTVENREAVLCVKNVAGYEMDFTAEEVLGRFFRGDKNRSTEGSGLGLAIAKEFSECCGGALSVDISGDVFCVEIRFDCCDVIYL